MQIKLDLKVFIFILFFFVTKQLEIYLYLMIFALFHEFGHLGMGIVLGLKPQNLKVMPVGFAVSFKVDTKNYNKKYGKSTLLSLKKLIIALAGPLVNLIFIVVFIAFNQNAKFVYINILIFIFNMITLYPLDGGRILKYILYITLGKKKSLDIVHIISNITAIILTIIVVFIVFYMKNIAYIFTIIYIWIILLTENKKYKIRKQMYKILENYIAIN